jgi:hypothetical protein
MIFDGRPTVSRPASTLFAGLNIMSSSADLSSSSDLSDSESSNSHLPNFLLPKVVTLMKVVCSAAGSSSFASYDLLPPPPQCNIF